MMILENGDVMSLSPFTSLPVQEIVNTVNVR
jgi:hypothetical protein